MVETSNIQSTDDVKILSKGVGKWKVKLCLPLEYVQGKQALFSKINQVKKQLAGMLELPPGLLEYGEVVSKEMKDDHLVVTLEISRKVVDSGPLAVHILPEISEYGVEFPDMIAAIDLYAVDLFGSLINVEKINSLVEKNRVARELVQWDVIQEGLERLLANYQPILGLVIARGEFPDPGEDAELIFPTVQGMSMEEISQDADKRRVRGGEVLVKKFGAKHGSKDGMNVRGEVVRSPTGGDIRIEAGRGTIINLKGTEITAQTDGLMTLEFLSADAENRDNSDISTRGCQVVRVMVSPLKVIETDNPISVCTNSSIEVVGNVMSGSRIISSAEIIVKGDVEAKAVLESKEDIHVQGAVQGGSLTSQKNVYISDGVSGGEVTAKNRVRIDGMITGAKITGREVTSKGMQGGKVTAKEKIVVGKVEADENGQRPEIKIGIADFHENRVVENEKFIAFGNDNLTEMKQVFGEEIVEKVNSVNVKAMFLKHIKEQRLASRITYKKNQIQAILQLLDSTSSIRELLTEKSKENEELTEVIRNALGALKELVILEGNAGSFEAKMGTKMVEIPQSTQGIKLRQEGINDVAVEVLQAEGCEEEKEQEI
jgi:uncharacterized protein (DUF342 family)